jgi:hypothetical protein
MAAEMTATESPRPAPSTPDGCSSRRPGSIATYLVPLITSRSGNEVKTHASSISLGEPSADPPSERNRVWQTDFSEFEAHSRLTPCGN